MSRTRNSPLQSAKVHSLNNSCHAGRVEPDSGRTLLLSKGIKGSEYLNHCVLHSGAFSVSGRPLLAGNLLPQVDGRDMW